LDRRRGKVGKDWAAEEAAESKESCCGDGPGSFGVDNDLEKRLQQLQRLDRAICSK
jgi:hypothetical protein